MPSTVRSMTGATSCYRSTNNNVFLLINTIKRLDDIGSMTRDLPLLLNGMENEIFRNSEKK